MQSSFSSDENRIKGEIQKAGAAFDSNIKSMDEIVERVSAESRTMTRRESDQYEKLQSENDSLLNAIDELEHELKAVQLDPRRRLFWDIRMEDYRTYEEYVDAKAEARYPTDQEWRDREEQLDRQQFEYTHRTSNASPESKTLNYRHCCWEQCGKPLGTDNRKDYCDNSCQRRQQNLNAKLRRHLTEMQSLTRN